MPEPRPSVSVVVPFAGSQSELERLLGVLQRHPRNADDELIVADNRRERSEGEWRLGAVRVCPAGGVRAAGFARNCGAGVARGEWLVFIDADTRPSGTLLDDYFDPMPSPSTAVLAGGIVDIAEGGSLAARHSATRGHMSQRTTLQRVGSPYAQTANCAVLRSAFASLGGFTSGIRAGEDADLCFRLERAGWRIEERAHARVAHRSRETIPALLGQLARHGSGAAWLNRRYAGEFPPPRPRQLVVRLARSAISSAAQLARGDLEGAAFALLDIATAIAFELGRRLPNRAPGQ